jgi:hypothetical protein
VAGDERPRPARVVDRRRLLAGPLACHQWI